MQIEKKFILAKFKIFYKYKNIMVKYMVLYMYEKNNITVKQLIQLYLS